MSRHKMTEADARLAVSQGMLLGYELGFDAAVELLERMEDGEDGPGWSRELKKVRAAKIEHARKEMEAMGESK